MLIAFLVALTSQELKNGSFAEWDGETPAGWEVSVGAGAPNGRESLLAKGSDGGIAFSGDAATRRWRTLSQSVEAASNDVWRLRFEARAQSKLEEGQFNNCYISIAFLGEKLLDRRLRDIRTAAWTDDAILLRAPSGTKRIEVRIFLSKTGSLEVKSLRLDKPDAKESYAILVDELKRHYSYTEHKKLDLDALAAKHAGDLDALLAALRDPHVAIREKNAWRSPFALKAERNGDFGIVARSLKQPHKIIRSSLIGRTTDGFGYAAIGSLQLSDATFREIEEAIEELLDAPGVILDLRANGGGDERRAAAIATKFCDKTRVYAKHTVRGSSELFERKLEASKTPYTKPVMVLIGPVTMSSAEGFTMMMKSLPHVTLVGLATRGASGNPQPVDLPNGMTVLYSTWVDMLPDGTVIEGKGIAPDIEVRHEAGSDKAFERAVEELKKKAK